MLTCTCQCWTSSAEKRRSTVQARSKDQESAADTQSVATEVERAAGIWRETVGHLLAVHARWRHSMIFSLLGCLYIYIMFWINRGAYAFQFAYIDILYVYIHIQCQFTICLSTDLRSNCYCVVICGVQVRIHVFKYCSTDYDDVTVNFQVHLLFVSDRPLSGTYVA